MSAILRMQVRTGGYVLLLVLSQITLVLREGDDLLHHVRGLDHTDERFESRLSPLFGNCDNT